MQLFPAIDLRGGQVVRLTQGDYDRMTVYGQDPCAQARSFVAAGAKNLHVVDLDGAKDGTLSNYDTIAALAKQGGLYIEVGGGIRDEDRIRRYLDLGVGRCILGTIAVKDFAFTERMARKYGVSSLMATRASLTLTITFPPSDDTILTVPPATKPRSSRCFLTSALPPTLRIVFSSPAFASVSGIITYPSACCWSGTFLPAAIRNSPAQS